MKKNLITVLKKLLTAFGGEDTNSNNAVDLVDKIADQVGEGGGSSGGSASPQDSGKTVIVGNDGKYVTRLDFKEVTDPYEVLPETEVTIEDHGRGEIYGDINFNTSLPNTITVIYDGQTYENLSGMLVSNRGLIIYGGYDTNGYTDFSIYPFSIIQQMYDTYNLMIYNNVSTGTHTIKIISNPMQQQLNLEQNFTATENNGQFFGEINARCDLIPDKINVEFDGVIYNNLIKKYNSSFSEGPLFGELDINNDITFTNYPFFIKADYSTFFIYTQTEGEHSIKIHGLLPVLQIDDEFKKVILKIIDDYNTGK